MRRFLVGVAVGAMFLGGVWAWVDGRRVPEVVQLPPEIIEKLVPVETVKTIPGPPSVVERWKVRTVPGAVDQEALRELALSLCEPIPRETVPPGAPAPTIDRPRLEARIEIEADRHVGRDGDRIVAGWTGQASCQTKAGDGPWKALYAARFDQEASEAVSTLVPEAFLPHVLPRSVETAVGVSSLVSLRGELRAFGRGRKWGFWAGLDYLPDPASYSSFTSTQGHYYDQAVTTQSGDSEPSWAVAVGVARRWGMP